MYEVEFDDGAREAYYVYNTIAQSLYSASRKGGSTKTSGMMAKSSRMKAKSSGMEAQLLWKC
jgi:hypothetical protein